MYCFEVTLMAWQLVIIWAGRVPVPDKRWDFLCEFYQPVRWDMVPFLLPWNFSWRATERMTLMTHMAEKASMCHVYVRQLKCIYNKNWTLQFVTNNIVYNKCHQCQPFCDGYSSTYWSLPMSTIVSVLPVFQGHSSIKQPPEYNGCC